MSKNIKGLADKKLIEKYESEGIDFKKTMLQLS